MSESCPKCQSTRIEKGSMVGAAIQLDRASALRKAFASPEIKATVCRDCGHIGNLHADPAKLASLLGE